MLQEYGFKAQGKKETKTNFVVTVGFTTEVNHQTTSKKMVQNHDQGKSGHFIGSEVKKG